MTTIRFVNRYSFKVKELVLRGYGHVLMSTYTVDGDPVVGLVPRSVRGLIHSHSNHPEWSDLPGFGQRLIPSLRRPDGKRRSEVFITL